MNKIIPISFVGLVVLLFSYSNISKRVQNEPSAQSTISEWQDYLSITCKDYNSFRHCGYFPCYINGNETEQYGDLVGFVKADNTPQATELCKNAYPNSYHFEINRAF